MRNKILAKQIKAWSFSRYSAYQLCPLKAKLQFIDNLKQPPNVAMKRGADVHDQCEAYIKGQLSRIPPECKAFSKEFKMLRKQYKKAINGMVVEDTWAFTKKWEETQWDDWVHCWVRIKLDCAHHEDIETLIVSDWKTGKFRPDKNEDYVEQLELYALAALLLHEHIEVVKPRLVYLDAKVIYPELESKDEARLTFVRADIDRLKRLWTKRIRPMLSDKKFAPRPNFTCQWCHFRNSNASNGGGQCKY